MGRRLEPASGLRTLTVSVHGEGLSDMEEDEDQNKPPLERNASPEEVAASFLFLATDASAQITGQVLHPNGGLIING